MSLADELLADLDGLADSGDEYAPEGPSNSINHLKRKSQNADDEAEMSDIHWEEPDLDEEGVVGLVLDGGVKPADELYVEDVQQMELGGVEDVSKITKLDGSKRMNDI